MISKIKSGLKSHETYVIIAVAAAGVIQYFISANTGTDPNEITPTKVLAELKASGIHNIDVDTVIAMTESMKESSKGYEANGIIGLFVAAFLATVNIVNRVALKYKEISSIYQKYGDMKEEIERNVSHNSSQSITQSEPKVDIVVKSDTKPEAKK